MSIVVSAPIALLVEGERFLAAAVEEKIRFDLHDRLLSLLAVFDLRADALFLRAKLGREFRAEVLGLEELADLDHRLACR